MKHLLFGLLAAGAALADTTITIQTNVVTPGVRRMGLNIAMINYYDSGQVMKELLFNNPGFEGLIFSSVIQVGTGTPTGCVESQPFTQWPSGFWNNARYEFIHGAAAGRTGIVASSTNPRDPGANSNGTEYVFADSGVTPSNGDWFIVRKLEEGDSGWGGQATAGWSVSLTTGGAATTEFLDLATNTPGRQCVRLTATNAGAQASLSGQFDTWPTAKFVLMNGQYRLAFRAKGVGGANQLLVTLRRGTGAYWINQTLLLATNWTDYVLPFGASETGLPAGGVSLQFRPANQSAVLLDDVSLRQTNSNPANGTPFRDPVWATLNELRPAFLRYPAWQHFGDTLDNELAEPWARRRTEYSAYATSRVNLQLGLHEFLLACEGCGAFPWCSTPTVFTPQEMANLLEYLGGPTNTPYGARRAALGHPQPWTEVFERIYVEFGNESWNDGYRGGGIFNPLAFGRRGSALFGAARASPYYKEEQFNLILGDQAGNPWRVRQVNDASTNHDQMAVAPYMFTFLENYASEQEIFTSLFAEPEWWCRTGGNNALMLNQHTNLQAAPRPVPLGVYEINLNIPNGSPPQWACDAYQATLGGGLAVATFLLRMAHDLHIRDFGLFSLAGFESPHAGHTNALWSLVHDMGVTDRKRPQYLAAQLINDAMAGDLVGTAHAGDDPTWSVTGLNQITFTNAHQLQSFAFASATNHVLVVMNLSLSNALPVNFAGPYPPRGRVTVRQLASPNLTDHNEASNVVALTTQVVTNFDPAVAFVTPAHSMTLLQWPAPRLLAVQAGGGQVELAWAGAGLVLQTTTNLHGGGWTNLPAGEQSAALPLDDAPLRIFRLVR